MSVAGVWDYCNGAWAATRFRLAKMKRISGRFETQHKTMSLSTSSDRLAHLVAGMNLWVGSFSLLSHVDKSRMSQCRTL